jgi:hypothetical protein
LLQNVLVYINHHQGATACTLPKLQYWLQYTSRRWRIQYYGHIFFQSAIKGLVLKYMNKLKWDQNIEKLIHKKREVGLTLLCGCIMHCAERSFIRVRVVGHVRYRQARIVGLCHWLAAQLSICYACDTFSLFYVFIFLYFDLILIYSYILTWVSLLQNERDMRP